MLEKKHTFKITSRVCYLFQVMSKANIILQDSIAMKSTQTTFAIALSRDMVPESKIVVYGLLGKREIIADSLQFHVDGLIEKEVNKTTYL